MNLSDYDIVIKPIDHDEFDFIVDSLTGEEITQEEYDLIYKELSTTYLYSAEVL